MVVKFTGVSGEMKRIKAEIKKLQKEAGVVLFTATMAGLTNYINNTPVWSGESVANYKVGVGGPPTGLQSPVGGRIAYPGPVPSGVANEGRRSANTAAAHGRAIAKLKTVQSGFAIKQGLTVYIKNTIKAEKAARIESGSAPTPSRSRYPGGVTPRAIQAVKMTSGGDIT